MIEKREPDLNDISGILKRQFIGHDSNINRIFLHREILFSIANTVKLWNVKSGAKVGEMRCGQIRIALEAPNGDLVFGGDNQVIVIFTPGDALVNGTIRQDNIKDIVKYNSSGSPLSRQILLSGLEGQLLSAAFLPPPDEYILVVTSVAGYYAAVNIQTGEIVCQPKKVHLNYLWGVVPIKLNDKYFLVTSSSDNMVKTIDLFSGTVLDIDIRHIDSAYALEVLPSGYRVSGGYDNMIYIFGMHNSKVASICLGQDVFIIKQFIGDIIVCNAGKKCVFLDLSDLLSDLENDVDDLTISKTIAKILRNKKVLEFHASRMTDVVFTSNKECIYTSSNDKTIVHWEGIKKYQYRPKEKYERETLSAMSLSDKNKMFNNLNDKLVEALKKKIMLSGCSDSKAVEEAQNLAKRTTDFLKNSQATQAIVQKGILAEDLFLMKEQGTQNIDEIKELISVTRKQVDQITLHSLEQDRTLLVLQAQVADLKEQVSVLSSEKINMSVKLQQHSENIVQLKEAQAKQEGILQTLMQMMLKKESSFNKQELTAVLSRIESSVKPNTNMINQHVLFPPSNNNKGQEIESYSDRDILLINDYPD